MIEVGETVGNYRITAKLGEGGMGAVYLAEHPVIGRKAALKVIHPQHSRNAEVVARFVNEATAISRIGHEHIVAVTDLGRTPAGDLYFSMEYLEGHALSDLIAREAPLVPARALGIALQIADALASAHAHGVIHRDLKPDNVFLVSRGSDPAFVKVLDFGLAKLMGGDGGPARDSRAGIVMGTPHYMSPEQCRGELDVDGRADVYALGVVIFQMITGIVPFPGDQYDEVLLRQVAKRPPSLRTLIPELPAALDAAVQRALAKRRDERFATMAAFGDALRACAGRGRLRRALPSDLPRWRPDAAGPIAALARLSTTFGHAALARLETSRRAPRRRGAFALGGVAAVAGVLLAAWLAHADARGLGAAALAHFAPRAPALPAPPRFPTAAPAATNDDTHADAGATPFGATLETRFEELR